MVIATDGYVMVEEEVFDLIRKNLGDTNMFTFGIGSSVNRHLLEGMARVGMGEPFIITKPEETREKAERFRKMIESPVLTKIKVNFGPFDVFDVDPISIPDVFAERPIIVFGKWRGRPVGEITLSGKTGSGPYLTKIDLRKEKPQKFNSALRYLWARHRIILLSDYNLLHQDKERVKEVTQLGLTYNLLTAYTSFVAIDTEVRLVNGQSITVKQPLPLPEGVSDYAVKGRVMAQKMGAPFFSTAPIIGSDRMVKEERSKDEESVSKPVSVSVAVEDISTPEGLSKEAFEKVINRQILSIELCYQKILKTSSTVKGKVTLRLVVDPKGQVKKVLLSKSGLNHKNLEQCIIEKMKKMKFPETQRSEHRIVSVSFRLDFS